MPSRRPARWLAPLALLASVVAVLVVISANRSSSGSGSTATSQSAPAGTTTGGARTTTTSKRRSGSAQRAARTYRVQSGDTLLRVAERTGVPIERIRTLNPTVDANALRVGQSLRLRPASP